MLSRKLAVAVMLGALMLVAGSAFAQNTPEIKFNTMRTGNPELDKNIDWALGLAGELSNEILTPERKAEIEKKAHEAVDMANKAVPYLGGFGAVDVNYLPIDMDPFEPMTEDRDIDNFGPLWTVGGRGGVIYKNLRFGGFGFGASQKTEEEAPGEDYEAFLQLGGGGIFLELDTTSSRKAGLFIGSDVGAGAIKVKAKGPDLAENFEADRDVFFAYPYAGFWLAPTDWMWVRVHGGYNYFHITTTNDEFENVNNEHMVDGSIRGNYQVGVSLCFGYLPTGK